MNHLFKLMSAGLLTGVLFGCSTAGGGSIPAAVAPVSTDGTSQVPELNPDVPIQDLSTMSTTTTTTGPAHVMTGDYFDSPWGTTRVSPTSAKPYLTYVRTGIANATLLHNAGYRVQVYTDPNRLQTNDPLYAAASTSIAKSCASAKVYDKYSTTVQYVPQPANTALRTAFSSMVTALRRSGNLDQVFMDNTGALPDFGVKYYPTLPCGYSDSTWIADERTLIDESSTPVIFNGLSALHNEGVSLGVQVLSAAHAAGGEYEHCFSDNSRAEQGSWPWTATENTQLQVAALYKQFHCQSRNTAAASSSYPSRIYTIASFLMTYNPNYSVLWEEYATTSGLHVMPESGIVPLGAEIHPSNVAELRQASGVYVRKYAHCYYRGRSIGACAMAVNPDYSAHPLSLSGYHHTVALSGQGVMEGGTVSFAGPAPASTLAATSALIAVP